MRLKDIDRLDPRKSLLLRHGQPSGVTLWLQNGGIKAVTGIEGLQLCSLSERRARLGIGFVTGCTRP